MTVSALITRNDITATASQTVFIYTFRVIEATDMAVYQNGVLLSSGYTVTGVNNTTGGTVVLDVGVPAGQIVSLVLAMPLDRTTNYQNSGKFLASNVNEDFDKIYIGAIQNENEGGRSLRLNDVEPPTTGVDMTIPLKADRKGKFLAFDSVTGAPVADSGSALYDSAAWNAYNFTGDGSTVTFTLGSNPNAENNTQVYIDGIYQQKDGYSVSGAVLTFSVAPPNLSTIEVMVTTAMAVGATSSDLVSYTPAGTGAVATTVQTKLRESVSVMDFGAVGDGITDDTAAIQSAIDFATLLGGTVIVPNGTYLCNIIIKSDVTFVGENKNTTLKPYVDTAPVISIDTAGAKNFHLSNFQILGTNDITKTGQHGIYSVPVGGLVSVNHFTISNIKIYQVGGYGIRLESSSLTGPLVQLFELNNVHIRDSHKSCFSFIGCTLDFSMIACNGQLSNTDILGAYPVCELDGNGVTLAGASINTCWFNHSGATDGNTSSSVVQATGLYIYDAQNIGINDCSIENADPFIDIDGASSSQHITITNLRCNSPRYITNMVDLGRARYVKIINSKFLTTATATVGIKQTSGTMAHVRQVAIDSLTQIVGATTSEDIKRNTTISSGKAYYYRDILDLFPEGGSADDLNYIYGASGTDVTTDLISNSQLIIRNLSGSAAITIKHNTGNIFLNGAADLVLNTTKDFLMLTWYDEINQWIETGRCVN